jgi:rhodanese-related sulfurtransferase
MGPVVGIIGNLQVMELIHAVRKSAVQSMENPTVKILDFSSGIYSRGLEVEPSCYLCHGDSHPMEVVDSPPTNSKVQEMTHEKFFSLLQSSSPPVVVDVREKHYYDLAHITGSYNYPSSEGVKYFAEWGTKPIVVVCRKGITSRRIVSDMIKEGACSSRIYSLSGGLTGLGESCFIY